VKGDVVRKVRFMVSWIENDRSWVTSLDHFQGRQQRFSLLGETLENLKRIHHTRGLCQILYEGFVMSVPHIWIMGSLLKHTFRDASHCLSHCLLNLERIQWVSGFISLIKILWRSVFMSHGR
jgi:hypothetical protein